MNDKIHKALGIFLDAMRPFVVSFLQQHFPNEPWEGLFCQIKTGKTNYLEPSHESTRRKPIVHVFH